jgi:hypothetical protein
VDGYFAGEARIKGQCFLQEKHGLKNSALWRRGRDGGQCFAMHKYTDGTINLALITMQTEFAASIMKQF